VKTAMRPMKFYGSRIAQMLPPSALLALVATLGLLKETNDEKSSINRTICRSKRWWCVCRYIIVLYVQRLRKTTTPSARTTGKQNSNIIQPSKELGKLVLHWPAQK
jgi:hypothetical protein